VNAEATFNMKLRTRQMESAFAEVALIDGVAPLPADFNAFKGLWTTSSPITSLKVTTNEYIRSQNSNAAAPAYFALEGSNVLCYPTAGSVKGIYYQTIPALAVSSTNWLDDAHHDLYLFECLRQASIYAKNEQAAIAYGGMADKLLNTLISTDKAQSISGGPLSARNR